MKRLIRKENLWLVILALLLITVNLDIVERKRVDEWVAAIEFFKNTNLIESISIYNHIDDKTTNYNDEIEIQELIKPYQYTNRSTSPRKILKQKVELTYSVTVNLSDGWVEKMKLYCSDTEIVLDSQTVSFEVNDKHYVLLFRNQIYYIAVIPE